MSRKQKDGGPAFPMIESDFHGDGRVFHYSTGGMSLRDYFAGQALEGMAYMFVMNPEYVDCENAAKQAYKVADAMIAEREKQND